MNHLITSARRRWLLLALLSLIFASCGTTKKYVLLNDISHDTIYQMPPKHQLHVKRGDNLRIVVMHKLPEIAAMFNHTVNALEGGESLTTYNVNEDGLINFPHIGNLHVEGLTCSEIERTIERKISDEGLANGATVSVKITNFKVTVIGESATGVYEFDDEIVTLLDLVAKADLAQGNNSGGFGGIGIRRDKILVMREENGEMYSEFVSLLSTDIFYSPFFYLQQNDIVYVWPAKTTIRGSNRIVDFWLSRISIVTSAASIITLIVTLFANNNKN